MREVKAEQRSAEWFDARKGRITGSRIGAILGLSPYQTSADVMRAMVRDYHCYPSEFDGNEATKWGQLNEDNALFEARMETGVNFKECGLFIHPCGWLAASPDAISDNEVLEIKCPFSKRNGGEFKTVFEQLHYYAQAQYEMLCTGRESCVFFQWSPVSSLLERIELDQAFIAKSFPLLEAFYMRYLLEIKQPQKHLEPLRKKIEIDVEPYLQAKKSYETAKLAFENRRDELIEHAKASGRELIDFGLVQAALVTRVGAVDYKKIPELKGVDLEQYRKKPTQFWTLK